MFGEKEVVKKMSILQIEFHRRRSAAVLPGLWSENKGCAFFFIARYKENEENGGVGLRIM